MSHSRRRGRDRSAPGLGSPLVVFALAVALFLAAAPAASAYSRPWDPICSNSEKVCGGVSEDGSRFVFETYVPLVPEDTNGAHDVYTRFDGKTILVSAFPNGQPIDTNSQLLGMSADGTRIFFNSLARLTADDARPTDRDIYEWHNGQISLVSKPAPGVSDLEGANGAYPTFGGNSADGRHVFFTSWGHWTPDDTDGAMDVFERSGGETIHVSAGPDGDHPAWKDLHSQYVDSTPDGNHVFFDSQADLTGNTPPGDDIFDRFNGTTSWALPIPDAPNDDLQGGGVTPDASHFFFMTTIPLVAEDQDAGVDAGMDVYDRSGGAYELISAPSESDGCYCPAYFGGASDDGSIVYFESRQSFVPADTDGRQDVYKRTPDGIALVSRGSQDFNGPFDAWVDAVSSDGTRAVIHTKEQLLPEDDDDQYDVYLRDGDTTRLISTGPLGGDAEFPATYTGSEDGMTVITFRTAESLVGSDTDHFIDVYSRSVLGQGAAGSARASAASAAQPRTRLISNERIAPKVTIGPARPNVSRGVAPITIACPRSEEHGPCRGPVRLFHSGTRLGTGWFRVKSGQSRTVSVSLTSQARAKLQSGPLTALARARGRDGFGNAKTVRRSIVLQP